MTEINYAFRLSNDSVFKEIFSRVPNALAALISECMNVDYHVFKDNIQIERSELNKSNTRNKSTTCDFIVKIEDNFKINIEINSSNSKGLEERNFLFISRLYSNMIPKGTKYKDLVNYKVAQININRFSNINNKVLSRIMLTDLDTNIPTIQSIILYNFDIVKSSYLYYNKDESNTSSNDKLIRWGALLNTENIEDIADILGDDLMSKEDTKRFIEVAEEVHDKYVNFTKEQLEQHEEFKLAGERMAGIEQGIEKGIVQGIELTKIETVKNMLIRNYELEEICKISGLTEEEIKKIQNELN